MTSTRPTRGRHSYLDLVQLFPVRPLRNEADHAAAVKVAVRLSGREAPALSRDESDYLSALLRMIDDFESLDQKVARAEISGVDALRFLMGETSLGISDVGRIIGSQSAASEILSGRRDLSKTHIRKLADHFRLSAALFLR